MYCDQVAHAVLGTVMPNSWRYVYFSDTFLWLLIGWYFFPNSTRPGVETQKLMFPLPNCCQRKISPNFQKSLLSTPKWYCIFFFYFFSESLKSIRTRKLPRQTQFTMSNLWEHQSCTVPYTAVPRAQKQAFGSEHSFPPHSAVFPLTLSHFAQLLSSTKCSCYWIGFCTTSFILNEKYILYIIYNIICIILTLFNA